MAEVWSDDGIKAALDLLLRTNGAGLDGAKVHLYTGNLDPDTSTTLATLAATEATFPGYAAVTLDDANWPAASLAAHVASSAYGATVQFICTGGGASQNIYGWYLTNSASTVLYCSGRLNPAPLAMLNDGDTIDLAFTATERTHV